MHRIIQANLLKARTVNPEKQTLPSNGCVTRNDELMEAVFLCSVRANEGQLPLRKSPESTEEEEVGGDGRQPARTKSGSRGMSAVGRRYQAAQKTVTENISMCVIVTWKV
jgi:hypothetical protein